MLRFILLALFMTSSLPAMALKAQVDKSGKRILFFREGEDYFMKKCAPGQTPKDCTGETYQFSKRELDRKLKETLLNGDHEFARQNPLSATRGYKPYTFEEIRKTLEDIKYQLVHVDPWNREGRPATAEEEKRLEDFLEAYEKYGEFEKQAVKEIDELLAKISDPEKLWGIECSEEDRMGHFLLTNLDTSKTTKISCGHRGSIDERIKDCATMFPPKSEGPHLVARIEKYGVPQDFYYDPKTKLVWSELPTGANYSNCSLVAKVLWRNPTAQESALALESGFLKSDGDRDVYWQTEDFNYYFPHRLKKVRKILLGSKYRFNGQPKHRQRKFCVTDQIPTS